MKEFRADTGGRYTYNDDVLNLQELALAFGEIFSECDNFIVSGCEVNGASINDGYVYINKKLRRFRGASGILTWPQYITELNYTENTQYLDTTNKIARTVYSCELRSAYPTENDQVTGEAPGVIVVNEDGALAIKDAFFGKYALLRSPKDASQAVNSNVSFNGNVSVSGYASTGSGFKTEDGNSAGWMHYDDGSLVIEWQKASISYAMSINENGGFKFSINGETKVTIDNNTLTCQTLNASVASVGGLMLSGDNIYQGKSDLDSASLNINMVSKDGATTKFRTTKIGNGKGRELLTVVGSTNTVFLSASQTIVQSYGDTLRLHAATVNINNYISWYKHDDQSNPIAQIGHNGSASTFIVKSITGNVSVTGHDFVDIGPAIKENGVLLSEKYMVKSEMTPTISAMNNALILLQNNSAKTTGGLVQFVRGSKTKAVLRQEIEAASASDLNNYALKSNYLSDMATTEEAKEQIRTNIGAVSANDIPRQRDSGWRKIPDVDLYVRQIGNIVSIQGVIVTCASGTAFNIPTTIDAPTHSVSQTVSFENSQCWVVEITPNSHACKVKYCDKVSGKSTYFSLTYMV